MGVANVLNSQIHNISIFGGKLLAPSSWPWHVGTLVPIRLKLMYGSLADVLTSQNAATYLYRWGCRHTQSHVMVACSTLQ